MMAHPEFLLHPFFLYIVMALVAMIYLDARGAGLLYFGDKGTLKRVTPLDWIAVFWLSPFAILFILTTPVLVLPAVLITENFTRYAHRIHRGCLRRI